MMMNKEDLKAKALKKFDVWPYTDSNTMVGCMSGDNKLSDWTSHTTDHLSLYWTVVYTRKEFETDKKLTTPKEEIYWDGKEELKVGMWFLTGGTEHKAVTQIDVDGFLVIEIEGVYIIQCASSIKPIDKRTPREKAIAAIDKTLTSAFQSMTVMYIPDSKYLQEATVLFDKIAAGGVEDIGLLTGDES